MIIVTTAGGTENHHEQQQESVLKPNRPLKAKLGGGWEAKRARTTHTVTGAARNAAAARHYCHLAPSGLEAVPQARRPDLFTAWVADQFESESTNQ
jgi:hypothetical protein